MKLPKILALIFIFAVLSNSIIAQSSSQSLSDGMNLYNQNLYAQAYKVFNSIQDKELISDDILSTATYYAALSMKKLNQKDAAISQLEKFTTKFPNAILRNEALYELGLLYFNNGDFPKSRKRLLNLIETYPESEFIGEALYWIGKSYTSQNNFDAAIDFYKDAINKGKSNNYIDKTLYALANLYEDKGDNRNAIKHYDELLTYHKKSDLAPLTQYKIGYCYYKEDEYDNAVIELSDPLISKLKSDDLFNSKFLLGKCFIELKEYDNAINIFNSLKQNNLSEFNFNEVQYTIATIMFYDGKYEEAHKTFLELSENSNIDLAAKALYWSGECKRLSGNNQDALGIYQYFLERFPNSDLAQNVKYNIGLIELKGANVESSERFLNASLNSTDPTIRSKALILLGNIDLEKKKYNEAKTKFNEVISLSEIDNDLKNRATLGISIVEYFQNNYDEALKGFVKLNKSNNSFEKSKVCFYIAEIYMIKSEYGTALRYYSGVKKNEKAIYQQTIYGKAYAYFNLRDYGNASVNFKKFIQNNKSGITDARFRLGDCYFALKDFDNASKLYKKVLSVSKSYGRNQYLNYQYAQALYKSGNPNDAIAQFQNIQKRFPSSKYSDDSQYLIGWINFQRNNYSSAISNYKKLIVNYPVSTIIPIAFYSIGDAYFNLAKYDSAVSYYERIINKFPNSKYVYDAVNGIQYCYIAEGKIENAITYIDNFLANNPATGIGDKVLFRKGEIYFSNGDYNKAITSYNEFNAKYPSSSLTPQSYYRLAKTYSVQDKPALAKENYKTVIENFNSEESVTSAAIELCQLYIVDKEYDEAITLSDELTTKFANSKNVPELIFLKGQAQIEKTELSQAYASFNNLIMYYDKNVFASKAKIELGLLEFARGNNETAEDLFKEVSENRLDDIGAQAQYLLGVSYFQTERTDDAISAFVRVRSVFNSYDEWYSKSLLKLGDCYIKLKDKRKAKEMFSAVLKRHPKDELGEEANKKLKDL